MAAPSSSTSHTTATTRSSSLSCRVVTFHTTAGAFSIELYDTYAPRLTHHMYELAKSNAYNNTLFHKLVPGQYLQGGAATLSPSSTGSTTATTSAARKQHLLSVFQDDEIHSSLRFTGAGIVGFASAGPDLNSSQFFITLAPQPKFDGVFSVIGRVSSGMKVLQTLSTQYQVDPSTSAPYNPIRISHCSCGVYPRQRRPHVVASEERKRARDEEEVNGPSDSLTNSSECATVFKPLKICSAYA